MADDVCVMYAGQIVETGTREQVFSAPAHPYTRLLLASIPRQTERGHRLVAIPGVVPSATDYPEQGCRFYARCPVRLDKCQTVTPAMYPYGATPGHFAHCHLLDAQSSVRPDQIAVPVPRPARAAVGETLLAVRELTTHFPVKHGLLQRTAGYVRAVDGVSFELRRGETLALVGESGCGKTTVGQSVLRLIDEARGSVRLGGLDVLNCDKSVVKQLRKDMQIIFQDPYASLSPRLKVRAIIEEGLVIHEPHTSPAERAKRLKRVMDQVGLPARAVDRFPHEFSGGQRQRIAIARALILDPQVLILDEPTSALDVSVQAQILNLLDDIQRERQVAYLFITHNLGVVEYIADQVAVMYLGRIVEYAPTADLFRAPKHPYTQTLLQAVPKLDGPPGVFSRIEGDVPSPLHPPTGCHFHPRCPVAIDRCRSEYPALRRTGQTHVACHLVEEK
jgi:peptide/nickel transport system ATP-binding protein